MNTIDWEVEKDRFVRVAYPFAVRAARRAFRRWPERSRGDAQCEMVAKSWDTWRRLLERGHDPEPLLWPMIHWAKMWVRYDRRLAGRPRTLDIQDFRTGMVQHLLTEQGQPRPHDRSARINKFLDWSGVARTDDPAALVEAMEDLGLTLDDLRD